MRNRTSVSRLGLIPLAYAAFALHFDWRFYRAREFFSFVVAALLIKPIVFFSFGMYRRYWQYASVRI